MLPSWSSLNTHLPTPGPQESPLPSRSSPRTFQGETEEQPVSWAWCFSPGVGAGRSPVESDIGCSLTTILLCHRGDWGSWQLAWLCLWPLFPCPPLRLKGGPGPTASVLPSPSRSWPSDTRQPKEVSSIPGDETSRAELSGLNNRHLFLIVLEAITSRSRGQQCSVKNT